MNSNFKYYLLMIFSIGLIVYGCIHSSPSHANIINGSITATLDPKTIRSLYFACAVSGVLARNNPKDDPVEIANRISELMVEKTSKWGK